MTCIHCAQAQERIKSVPNSSASSRRVVFRRRDIIHTLYEHAKVETPIKNELEKKIKLKKVCTRSYICSPMFHVDCAEESILKRKTPAEKK